MSLLICFLGDLNLYFDLISLIFKSGANFT